MGVDSLNQNLGMLQIANHSHLFELVVGTSVATDVFVIIDFTNLSSIISLVFVYVWGQALSIISKFIVLSTVSFQINQKTSLYFIYSIAKGSFCPHSVQRRLIWRETSTILELEKPNDTLSGRIPISSGNGLRYTFAKKFSNWCELITLWITRSFYLVLASSIVIHKSIKQVQIVRSKKMHLFKNWLKTVLPPTCTTSLYAPHCAVHIKK